MSKCYIINEPLRYDPREGVMVPMFDLCSAEQFGQLIYVLPRGANPPSEPEEVLPFIKEAMKRYKADDYIVAIGDVHLVAWAAALAAKVTGGSISLLKWDSRVTRYNPKRAILW